MHTDDMTRLILSAALAVRPEASAEQLAEFMALDQAFTAECHAGRADRSHLFSHLQTIDPGPSATGRLRNALWIARHKCKVRIPKPTKPAGAGGAGGGGAQRRKRVRSGEEEER